MALIKSCYVNFMVTLYSSLFLGYELSIHSFLQYYSIQCVRPCSRHVGYSAEQNRHSHSSQCPYAVVRKDRQLTRDINVNIILHSNKCFERSKIEMAGD